MCGTIFRNGGRTKERFDNLVLVVSCGNFGMDFTNDFGKIEWAA